MATSLLYLGPYLGLYSILVTAGLGGVCIYSCYYSYYRVAGAAIKVTSNIAIRTTCSIAVKIASRISKAFYRCCCRCYCRDFCGGSYGYY